MHTLCEQTNDHKWIYEASRFSKRCHNTLLSNRKALWSAFNLGLTFGTIQDLQLGWNTHYKLLPEGLVVPTFSIDTCKPIKLTIYPENTNPFIVPGSKDIAVLYGNAQKNLPIIIVESQLEAILFHQFAGDLVHFLTHGSQSIPPLSTTQCLLFAIDNARALEKWKSVHPNTRFYRPPKLDTDPFTNGIKIRNWVLEAIISVDQRLFAYHQ